MKVLVLFLVTLQVIGGNCNNASKMAEKTVKNETDAVAVASNLRITTLDFVHTLWWDPLDDDNDGKRHYTVFYADYYFEKPWTPLKNCVDVTHTNCVIDVYFDPLETYYLWVTDQGISLGEDDLHQRDDVIMYSAIEELLHKTLKFSAPHFDAHREKNRVDITFRQIRHPWWNGKTMAEYVYKTMGERPKLKVMYYTCDDPIQPNCGKDEQQANYQEHLMKDNKMTLTTSAKDSDTLCLDVHLVFDEHVGNITSNHTKVCLPPESIFAPITPFVVASGFLFLLLIFFVYLFCRQNGKKVCWRALKIRQIEFPRPLDEILRERPNERTSELIMLDNTEESYEPLPVQFTASPHTDVTHRNDDVIVVSGQQTQVPLGQEETQITILSSPNEENELTQQTYLKATDLAFFPGCADESAVTYGSIISMEEESAESSVQYMTLTERLSSSLNVNNNNKQIYQHVCTSECGYLDKDSLTYALPCQNCV
uniref:Uncharacterized protein LOC100185317 n=1 Tax=Phallusia mammillata TaxID=59560 RepID=A0A6F9DIS8_9ASCI|nr:uncharacterized protein LOC100185317 [Phallusia mammillata]